MKKIFLLLLLLALSVFSEENRDENENGIRDDVESYLASALPPYNSVLYAGYDLARIMQKIADTKWKDNKEFKTLAVYYAKIYVKRSVCLDAVYYKKVGFSYENGKKLRMVKTTLKALTFDTVEKTKRFNKFNGLLKGKVFSIPVVTDKNMNKIIKKHCTEEVKNYLKYEELE